ncbi:MAG: hypothetical protein U1E34_02195 [Amaricoccus sp.]
MKRPLLALAALLAAACAAPAFEPVRSVSLDLPATCRLDLNQARSACSFVDAAGHGRAIAIAQDTASFAGLFPASARAMLEADPRGFWTDAVQESEVSTSWPASPGTEIRHAENRPIPPAPGAEACLRSSFDASFRGGLAGEVHGVNCALYDPATDRVGTFLVVYTDYRDRVAPPDPTVAAEADRLFQSLRFADAAPAEPK